MSQCVFVHIIGHLSIFLAGVAAILISLISVVIQVIVVIVIVLPFIILINRNATVLSGL
jgi:hypothetical protein